MIFYTNNGGALSLTQGRDDGPVTLDAWYHYGQPGQGCPARMIDPGDFVQLLNLYRYIKDNDIQNDWINPHGKNKEGE